MKNASLYVVLICMLLACKQSQQKQALEQPPGFYLTPQVVPLNLQGGYKINPITGDSVKPLLTRKGDTIVTGQPIPLDSQVVWLDSLPPPKVIPLKGKPQVIRINTHIRKAGKPELVIPAKDLLIPPKDTNFVLTNHKGDTIPTGVPIPVQRRVVPAKQVKPVVTSPLRVKNDATHHFEYLSITNNTSLDNLLMDEQGNLWTGASSKVRKYNGSSTQFLTNTEWIEEPIARANSTDRGGNIWFITNTSIIKYNGRNFTYFFPVKKMYHNLLAKVSIGLNNDIWIGSFNKGVVRFDGTSVYYYTIKQGLASNNIYSVYNDSRGNTWFGTSKGISKYDGHSFINYELNKKSNILITAIVEDYNGNIWFGTSKGICKFDGKYFIWYTEKQGVTSKFITSLSVDQNNNLWISNRKGINKFNGVNFENFTTKEGLTSNFISSAIGDSMGNLWLGAGDKIIKYNPQSFIHYNSDHKSMAINTICEGNQGNILIGSFEGFSQITDTTITCYNRENGLPIKYSLVNALTVDQHNTMWFAISGKGLVKFDGEKMTHFTTQQGLISNNITSLIGDKAGNLWITTWDGISKFDGKSFTNYSTTLSRDFVTGAALDQQGHFWASIRFGGVVKITDKSLTHYSMKEGLPSNNLQLLKADKDPEVIWLSHEDGLISFKDISLHYYATKGPFRLMSKDFRGNYWLSNSDNIYNLIKHKTQKNVYKILSFNESDGLKKRYGRAQLINQNQKLWLGHSQGFTTLDLNKFTVPSVKPKARLERIEIDGQFLDFHHLADSTKQRLQARYDSAARFFNYPVNLSLPYDQNQLTFHFSAIEWRAPHKIRYSYRLKGLTDKWSEPSASTVADYRILPLPYGDYTFQVCAVGQAQEWGEVFEYHFTIRPPWWYTWWAKAFYVLIVLMAIGAYIRWRTAGLRKRQKLLEQALIGPLIAGYRLLEQIGEGGFGLIYKATQLNTGQTVAIKVLKNTHLPTYQKERFERETNLCAQINHPHIVKLLDKGQTEDGDPFATFEFIDGETLKHRISRNESLPPEEIGVLMGQVLDALACAHQLGIVHRDLKPQNIMVTQTGATPHTKVLDFGIGALIPEYRAQDYKSLTLTKETIGTPSYSAPEQLWGEPPTIQSDLYAWGLILIECFTGEPVMGGGSIAEIFKKQINPENVPIPVPLLDHPLGELLQQVLEKNPHKRVSEAAYLHKVYQRISFNTLANAFALQASLQSIESDTIDNHSLLLEGNITQQMITTLCVQLNLLLPTSEVTDKDLLAHIQKQQLNRLQGIVLRYGGHVVNTWAGYMNVYFGYPQPSDQHALYAARAALEILQYAEKQTKESQELELTVKISLHSGRVLNNPNELPDGLVPSIAFQLLGKVGNNSILISEDTQQLLNDTLQLETENAYTFDYLATPLQTFLLKNSLNMLDQTNDINNVS